MKKATIVALAFIVATIGLRGFAVASPPELAATPTARAAAVTATPGLADGALTRTATRAATATRRISATPDLTTTQTITTTPALTITQTITASATLTATETITTTPTAMVTPTLELTVTPTPTSTATRTPSATSTPTRYPLPLDANALSIDTLRARNYGGSGIKITRVISNEDAFRRVFIEYPSDGLRITGMMNVPRGVGPFPVVVLDHGYFKPSEYKTGDGTIRAADAFARHGYLTLSPDYRCYAGSQCGANPLYVGYAIDVLNLIAQLPSLPDADTTRVGIWGHSMGGGITIRVLSIDKSIKVASLYGALSADDEVHYCWLVGCRTPIARAAPTRQIRRELLEEADPNFLGAVPSNSSASAAPPADPLGRLHEIFLRSSPSRHLSNVTAAVIIHHGEKDDVVPIQWSIGLAEALSALGKSATLYTYPGETHVFAGWGWQLFMERTLAFFDDYLNPHETPVTVNKRVLRQERIAEESSY